VSSNSGENDHRFTNYAKTLMTPTNEVLFCMHNDWMIVRYFGIAAIVVGVSGLFYRRRKPAAQHRRWSHRRC
jgi:hypothetical protein